ncbi:phosphatidate cytidylyltransferase [Marinomonas pollencensis]|uniref:Phosphatidate cytidylyltransferase n=1 Tax=Marinomonas pollencensis TaxID=491954 RepID=A0A3E0DU16_9GAMM|nr:phosphatidate cytidylyltransferase [Marinomonas pollencensis]REG86886.1 phosphatidate cytidylyltransferase [Marinomonas pollencensis]
MLLPRILSAIVMVFLFVCAVFVLEETNFMLAMGGVVLLAGWEWARLSGVQKAFSRIAFSVLVGVLCLLTYQQDLQKSILYVAPILWLIALYWVMSYPALKGWQHTIGRLLFGLLILVTTWASLVVLKQSSNFVVWVLLLMGLIWGADSGAYFSGKAFGKNKLAVHVSPGKSWEGVIGGLLFTQIGLLVFSVISHFSWLQWALLAAIGLLTVAVSVLGDLTESLFKRHESLKDSSRLIPGHGGVMDRVDSLTAAAPVFVLLLSICGWL